MVDIAADLSTLCFESGLADDEKKLLYLRARSAGLTFCGCAHAAFVCELIDSLRWTLPARIVLQSFEYFFFLNVSRFINLYYRCAIKRRTAKIRKPVAPGEDDDLRVGILGMGHLGKQLCLALLEKTKIKPSNIKISTRRPELAGTHTKSPNQRKMLVMQWISCDRGFKIMCLMTFKVELFPFYYVVCLYSVTMVDAHIWHGQSFK